MNASLWAISGTVLLSSLCSFNVAAYGQIGHRIIGEIAQNNLNEQASKQLMALTDGAKLAKLSTWADEIRSDKNWNHAAPWHYVSINDDQTWETVKRNPDGDIIESLIRFEKVLRDPKANKQDKWQALAFYIHFVGDLHQPLHVGYSHDRGGNDVKLKWFGEHTNLHAVWDSKLIDYQQLSYTEYTEFLNPINKKDVTDWSGKTYYQWADESKALRASTYKLEKNYQGEDDLSFKYIFQHKDTVNMRLQQAGVRLAEKLNAIFGK